VSEPVYHHEWPVITDIFECGRFRIVRKQTMQRTEQSVRDGRMYPGTVQSTLEIKPATGDYPANQIWPDDEDDLARLIAFVGQPENKVCGTLFEESTNRRAK
jgi:hypothetical protein